MTKSELLSEYRRLCDEKRLALDGIYSNSSKDEIQNAIDCLRCTDEELADYLTVVKLAYPNTYRTITSNGTRDFRRHSHNRLYVYNTARLLIGLVG